MEPACTKCGSARVIPEVPLSAERGVSVVIARKASWAVFSSDLEVRHITARICGDCGHTELLPVKNPEKLFEAYLSREEHAGRRGAGGRQKI